MLLVDHGKVEKNDTASLKRGIEAIMRNVCGDDRPVDTPPQKAPRQPSSTKSAAADGAKAECGGRRAPEGKRAVDVKPPAAPERKRRRQAA